MKADPSIFELISALQGGEFDGGSDIARMARYHGVVTFLTSHDRALSRMQQANQLRALRNLRHLRTLGKLLGAGAIPYLVVKGLPLSLRLYGDVGKRHAGDIDLWIPEPKVDAIHEQLLASGHRAKTGYAQLSPHYRARYQRRKFHIGYVHEPTGISVEIHWRLGGTLELFPISFDEAYGRMRIERVGEFEIPTLSDRDHLLFLHVHAARHLWERLFWLQDIAHYHTMPEAPAPEEILEYARRFGLDRAVLTGQTLAAECFDQLAAPKVAAPDELLRWGRSHLSSRRPGIPFGLDLRSALALHRSLRHKLAILAEHATAADDWHRLPLPDHCGWLYPILRPATRLLRSSGSSD